MSKATITITANDSYPTPNDIISTTDGHSATYQESVRQMVEMQRQALAKKNQRFPKGYM